MRRPWTMATATLTLALGCNSADEACEGELGTVFGSVVNALDNTPLSEVRVRSRRCPRETWTDELGRFDLPLPAGRERLWLDRDDFVEGQRANIVVHGGSRTEADARLFPIDPSDAQIATYFARQPSRRHAHPAHELTPRRGDVHRDLGARRASIGDGTLPLTIRVWRAGGSALEPTSSNRFNDGSCHAEAVVEEVPLEEYVKGVIPHEWIPTWHPEALRAGAIAARSYAVSWWRRGGRWACADVDDGTVTQVYRDGRAGPTNEAVDATAGKVVMRGGMVVSAEYSAENGDPTEFAVADPTCTGTSRFGHGRGMCQWGTHRWATGICANPPCSFGRLASETRDHRWMVEHYYPGASVAECAEPAEPCGVIATTGGIVDDAGPCFSAYGPRMYWRTEADGWQGGLHWTNAFEAEAPSNWARWRLHFEQPGLYRVEVYLTDAYAVYPAARYGIEHADGETTFRLDQGSADGWTTLAELEFDTEGAVMLYDDDEGPVAPDQRIVADAVRLTPLGAGARWVGAPLAEATPRSGCVVSATPTPLPRWAPLLLAALLARRRRRPPTGR